MDQPVYGYHKMTEPLEPSEDSRELLFKGEVRGRLVSARRRLVVLASAGLTLLLLLAVLAGLWYGLRVGRGSELREVEEVELTVTVPIRAPSVEEPDSQEPQEEVREEPLRQELTLYTARHAMSEACFQGKQELSRVLHLPSSNLLVLRHPTRRRCLVTRSADSYTDDEDLYARIRGSAEPLQPRRAYLREEAPLSREEQQSLRKLLAETPLIGFCASMDVVHASVLEESQVVAGGSGEVAEEVEKVSVAKLNGDGSEEVDEVEKVDVAKLNGDGSKEMEEVEKVDVAKLNRDGSEEVDALEKVDVAKLNRDGSEEVEEVEKVEESNYSPLEIIRRARGLLSQGPDFGAHSARCTPLYTHSFQLIPLDCRAA